MTYAASRPRLGGAELLAGLGVAGSNLEKTTNTKGRERERERKRVGVSESGNKILECGGGEAGLSYDNVGGEKKAVTSKGGV